MRREHAGWVLASPSAILSPARHVQAVETGRARTPLSRTGRDLPGVEGTGPTAHVEVVPGAQLVHSELWSLAPPPRLADKRTLAEGRTVSVARAVVQGGAIPSGAFGAALEVECSTW